MKRLEFSYHNPIDWDRTAPPPIDRNTMGEFSVELILDNVITDGDVSTIFVYTKVINCYYEYAIRLIQDDIFTRGTFETRDKRFKITISQRA